MIGIVTVSDTFLFTAAGVGKPKEVLFTVNSEAVHKKPKQKGKLS